LSLLPITNLKMTRTLKIHLLTFFYHSPPLPIGMYAVSKTALLGLVKGLAAELGPSHEVRGQWDGSKI
jgi:NAD(P)-dependent dehydrogenase (short-subunit alcohol dehydrogenase family)